MLNRTSLFNKFNNLQVIRERISTSTVLLIAKYAQNLRTFYVRRNAVVLRCEWPKNPEWTDEFYQWVKTTSRSYETTESEVSRLLQRRWNMLTDKQFKAIKINVRENL